MKSEVLPAPSPYPGIIFFLGFSILTILSWPGILEQFFSLDWKAGNMRPLAYGLQGMFGVISLGALLGQKRINNLYHKNIPTRKHLVFALFMMAISLIITLMALETACRIFKYPLGRYSSWTPAETPRAMFDPETGWSYIPDNSVLQQFVPDGGKIPVHTSNIGSRVRAPGVQHSANDPTVIFVGGSFTFGYGVPYEETFAGKLESMDGFPYQVINLGVEAYGTDQSLLILKRHFKKFNTKAVVYTFYDPHIPRNANYDRRFLFPGARFVGTKPLFGLNRDGALFLKKRPLKYEDLNSLRLWEIVQLFWTRRGPEPAYDITRALIQEMKQYVESNGSAFVVVHWDWAWGLQTPKREHSPLFEGMDLNLIDTGMNPPAGWSDWRIPKDSHPNARAHYYVSQLIFGELERLNHNME